MSCEPFSDPFDYIKRSRLLIESTTSDRAHELGYEYQSRGVWMDPRTGKRYKAVGTNFKELPGQEASASPTERPEKKTLSQMRQDQAAVAAPQVGLPNPQMSKMVPGGPSAEALDSGEVELVAKMLSRGRYGVLSGPQKQQKREEAERYIRQRRAEAAAKEAEAQAQAQAEAEAQAQAQAEPEPVEEPAKAPEDFPTLDDKVKEVEPEDETDGALDDLLKISDRKVLTKRTLVM